ncbi:hypothetical protein AVEN_35088-1 [Araneus ventricosus]|uniref:Uncharacterized protein n=1 Tax=Araneus ventricosus TaxID=182803 RepID=A0A4Y2VZ91_ARAVE|nr:hypothetical protein AVEN_35088-1 [Araneus ventricosus]
MKSTRTRAKNDVIGFRRSEPIILSDFLPQFYQGRVCKYATGYGRLRSQSVKGRKSCFFTPDFLLSEWISEGRADYFAAQPCVSLRLDSFYAF